MDYEKKCCETCVKLQEKDKEIALLQFERDELVAVCRTTTDKLREMRAALK